MLTRVFAARVVAVCPCGSDGSAVCVLFAYSEVAAYPSIRVHACGVQSSPRWAQTCIGSFSANLLSTPCSRANV